MRLFDNRWLLALVLLIPTILVLLALTWQGVSYCCDAHYYLGAIRGYGKSGLSYDHAYLGYRSYLFPYLFAQFPVDLARTIPWLFGKAPVYSLAAIGLFLVIEYFALVAARGKPMFWPIYIGLYLNPLVLIYVPFPLQESFIAIFFCGLLPMLHAAYEEHRPILFPGLLGLFLGVMYLAKASLVYMWIPALVLLFCHLKATRHTHSALSALLAFIIPLTVLLVPQSVVNFQHLDSVAIYPKSGTLKMQFFYGKAYSKYGTNISGRSNMEPAMVYWSPLSCTSPKPKDARHNRKFDCSTAHSPAPALPELLVVNALIHAFNSLNYDGLRPYVTDKHPALFSLTQALSATVVFLGLLQIVRRLVLRTIDPFAVFLSLTALLTVGVTTILAVETRFGLLATGALSVFAIELALRRNVPLGEKIAIGTGLTMVLVLSSLLSIYVLSLSGALSPVD